MENKNIFTKSLTKQLPYKILFLTLLAIIIFTVVIMSVFLWRLIIFKDNVDILSNFRIYTIVGDSMYPKLKPGDIIIVKKVSEDRLKSGDIIAFKRNSLVITHRINEIHREVFFTQGDNNITKDNFSINSENILGKYLFKIPKGDDILTVIRSPLFTILVFLLMLINITLLFRFF